MQKLAPFADDMNLLWNKKANNFMQGISIGYGFSLIVSLIFRNTLQCLATTRISPLTYIIYVTNVLCVFVRSYLNGAVQKTYNTMQLLFAIVLTFVCLVLTIIVMVTSPPWVDILVGCIFILTLILHFVLLWKLFQRLSKIK